MTESSAIVQYLVTRYGPSALAVEPSEPAYGAWLNWLHFGEATLTFPQTLVLRYRRFEPGRAEVVADDYAKWLRTRGTTRKTAAVASAPQNAPVQEAAKEKRKLSADEREKEKPLRARVKKIETRIATLEGEPDSETFSCWLPRAGALGQTSISPDFNPSHYIFFSMA